MGNEQRRVLLVDDEPNILAALEFLMNSQGFIIEKALNGQTAIKKAKKFHPEIIILDVMMPGMNGYEVASEIRKSDQFLDVKIVFLTAKGTSADKINGYDNGGDVYLTKPFDNDELMMIVSELAEYG